MQRFTEAGGTLWRGLLAFQVSFPLSRMPSTRSYENLLPTVKPAWFLVFHGKHSVKGSGFVLRSAHLISPGDEETSISTPRLRWARSPLRRGSLCKRPSPSPPCALDTAGPGAL